MKHEYNYNVILLLIEKGLKNEVFELGNNIKIQPQVNLMYIKVLKVMLLKTLL
jgi:hypothetical protein